MPDWPPSPVHRLSEADAYMVTASTYRKEPILKSAEHLTLVRDTLLAAARKLSWELQAWAVLPNHYHFIAVSAGDAGMLRVPVRRLHSLTARALNREDVTPGRRVWFQYWDSRITYQKSFLARLRYVHENPVHHGLVPTAERYEWCSAAWFARTGEPSFVRTVMGFPIERLKVIDVECGPEGGLMPGGKPPV